MALSPPINQSSFYDLSLIRRTIRELKILQNFPNVKKLNLIFPYGEDSLPNCENGYGAISKDLPYLKIKIDKNELIFVFHNIYPFRPPVFLINKIPWHKCYKINNPIALIELKRKTGIDCLTCKSLLSRGQNLWNPAIMTSTILNEYKYFKKIKQYLNSYYYLLKLNESMNYDCQLPTEIIEIIGDYIWLFINPYVTKLKS